MEKRETALPSNAAFIAAIYVDPRYQVFLKYPQQIIAQAHLTALWRRLQMLQEQESAGTTNRETFTLSSSESDNENTSEGDIIEEILAISESRSARSSQLP